MTAGPVGGNRAVEAPPIVLVPLDGSEASRAALPVATALARLSGASLQLMHVSEPALAAAEVHRRLAPDTGEVVRTATGDPASAILAAARSGATVVMTEHCGHPDAGTGLGHVAERVLRETRAPLVLVPPGRGERAWDPQVILLPLDGAPGSAGVVRHVRALARAARARLVLLHVANAGLGPAGEAGTFAAPTYADQPQHEWPAWREEFLDRAACKCDAREQMNVRVACGQVGPTTVRAAAEEDADLVAVAWHGVLDEDHAGTLRTLLTDLGCPVLVVRAD